MWQADGHASDYPSSWRQFEQHNRNDIMYPWVGATPGYGTNAAHRVVDPDAGFQRTRYSAERRHARLPQRLTDIRTTPSRSSASASTAPARMMGHDPGPDDHQRARRHQMGSGQARRLRVSTGLRNRPEQRRRSTPLRGSRHSDGSRPTIFSPCSRHLGYGLIKSGTGFSRATFDSAVAAMTPGGGTPLADALLDVKNTMVTLPFGGVPADEQRYLAMLTDGLLTAGAPMSSIPNGSFSPVAVFSMGFGTGVDVDYPTLQSMVDKGRDAGHAAGLPRRERPGPLTSSIRTPWRPPSVSPAFSIRSWSSSPASTPTPNSRPRRLTTCFSLPRRGWISTTTNWSFQLHAPDGTHGLRRRPCRCRSRRHGRRWAAPIAAASLT